jgi:hypothetical protein
VAPKVIVPPSDLRAEPSSSHAPPQPTSASATAQRTRSNTP